MQNKKNRQHSCEIYCFHIKCIDHKPDFYLFLYFNFASVPKILKSNNRQFIDTKIKKRKQEIIVRIFKNGCYFVGSLQKKS